MQLLPVIALFVAFVIPQAGLFAQSPPDFTDAANKATPAVVHIKAKVQPDQKQIKQYNKDFGVPGPFKHFFDDDFRDQYRGQRQPKQSSGSGVLMTSNGYIITNNHVVENANDIKVITHDDRQFQASIAGSDKLTDLALLKIEADGMPTMNPGNSGGALVNTEGKLVGINTAIATPTGTYSGYAFAIPVNIVKKVMKDLRQFGKVKRGYLGVSISDLNGKLAEKFDVERTSGVVVRNVQQNSAAKEAGLKEDDVIIRVDKRKVDNTSELQEAIGLKSPGEDVAITYIRKGGKRTTTATLKAKEEMTQAKEKQSAILEELGMELKELTAKEKEKFGVRYGIQVIELFQGPLKRQTNMKEGFIIMSVDGEPIDSIRDFTAMLSRKQGGILMEGRYPGSRGTYYYGFGM
ncbi:MAG: hypothetical protein BRD50_04495 [Bacteroidetes bacterium SW_11_45_7]|nr:MAG: hypothetical protein BRD50_04495 [Bacteroidetes bacterium SW_11_45_7]